MPPPPYLKRERNNMEPEWIKKLRDLANNGTNKLTDEDADMILSTISGYNRKIRELQTKIFEAHAILEPQAEQEAQDE